MPMGMAKVIKKTNNVFKRSPGIDGRATRVQDTGYVHGFSNAKHLVSSSSSGSLKSASTTTKSPSPKKVWLLPLPSLFIFFFY